MPALRRAAGLTALRERAGLSQCDPPSRWVFRSRESLLRTFAQRDDRRARSVCMRAWWSAGGLGEERRAAHHAHLRCFVNVSPRMSTLQVSTKRSDESAGSASARRAAYGASPGSRGVLRTAPELLGVPLGSDSWRRLLQAVVVMGVTYSPATCSMAACISLLCTGRRQASMTVLHRPAPSGSCPRCAPRTGAERRTGRVISLGNQPGHNAFTRTPRPARLTATVPREVMTAAEEPPAMPMLQSEQAILL